MYYSATNDRRKISWNSISVRGEQNLFLEAALAERTQTVMQVYCDLCCCCCCCEGLSTSKFYARNGLFGWNSRKSLEIPTENFTSALNYFLCIDACSRHERKRLVNGRKSVRKKLINIRDGFPSAVSDVSCTVSRQLDWYALVLGFFFFPNCCDACRSWECARLS